MNGTPLVSVVIPTNNRNDKLINCLNSVFNNTYKNIEVIVINDAPENDISTLIKKYNLKLIQNKKKMFAAYCRNFGARISKGPILFFLDDDNILDKNCIKNLIISYKDNMGLIGPLMYKKDKSLWFYGGKINWISPYAKPYLKKIKNNQLIETDVIPNAYLTLKSLYLNCGLENYIKYPNFHDDTDIAMKMKLRGYKNYITTASKLIHDYGDISTHITPQRLYQMVKSNILIEKEYAISYKRLLFYLTFLPKHMFYYFIFYIPFKGHNKIELYKMYLKGLVYLGD